MNRLKKQLLCLALLLGFSLVMNSVQAQIGFRIPWYTVGGGGLSQKGQSTVEQSTQQQTIPLTDDMSLFTDRLVIQLKSAERNQITFSIRDEDGRIIEQQPKVTPIGANRLLLDCSAFPEGTYFIEMNGPYSNQTVRIIKK